MFKVGEKIRYVTSRVRTCWNAEKKPEEKTGTIVEAFETLDKRPCYWVKGETELILEGQILGLAK